ncbi:MAG: hypothetical protein ACRCX2_08800 [Paraclostridium sp.]
MAKIFSFMAFDNHGEFLGLLRHRPSGEGLVTVWKDDLPKHIFTKEIGRIEKYNLQALHRMSTKEQEKGMEACKCK